MKAEDILSDVQLIDLDHREAQFVRAELIEKIDAAIDAAVADEREACAKVAESMAMIREHAHSGFGRAHFIAAAIRARNNEAKP